MQEEVPYSCEVVINSFQDKSPGLSVIEASIVVEKDSQQAIVIGKAGAKVKELGSLARTKLEEVRCLWVLHPTLCHSLITLVGAV